MNYAKNELPIKEWEYATSKVGKETSVSTLAVTNKRIIHNVKSERSNKFEEIAINDVKSLEYNHRKNSNALAMLMFVLAGIVFVAGVAMMSGAGVAMLLISVVIAGLLVFVGVSMWGQGSFSLTIYTKGISEIGLSTSAARVRSKFGWNKGGAKVRVKLDHECVSEIMDTIGALILENKE